MVKKTGYMPPLSLDLRYTLPEYPDEQAEDLLYHIDRKLEHHLSKKFQFRRTMDPPTPPEMVNEWNRSPNYMRTQAQIQVEKNQELVRHRGSFAAALAGNLAAAATSDEGSAKKHKITSAMKPGGLKKHGDGQGEKKKK